MSVEDVSRTLPPDETQPQIALVGNMYQLDFTEFFVVFQGKLLQCSTFLESIDVCFKGY